MKRFNQRTRRVQRLGGGRLEKLIRWTDGECASPIPLPKTDGVTQENFGMCSLAVLCIWGEGLTPGIDQTASPTQRRGYVVPQMRSNRWWISSVAGARVIKRSKEQKP
jgi:hypothetical protein